MSISINEQIIAGNFPDHTQALRLEPVKENLSITYDIETASNMIVTQSNASTTIAWNYESDAEMATLYFVVKHLRAHNPNIQLILEMPYIPNARMDRVNNDDEVFTLKYFAEFINDLKFHEVHVLDAHSSVSLALLNNVYQDDVETYIENVIEIENPDIVFMPDEGAHKRYATMIDTLPSTFGIKHRDWRTGNILSYEVAEPQQIKDARVLIVDDISSKGGTFYFAAKALLKAGAKSVSLYITHCEETIKDGELLNVNSPVENIYTANPLFDVAALKNSNLHKIESWLNA